MNPHMDINSYVYLYIVGTSWCSSLLAKFVQIIPITWIYDRYMVDMIYGTYIYIYVMLVPKPFFDWGATILYQLNFSQSINIR